MDVRQTVLIVDDSPEDRLAIRMYLEQQDGADYRFLEAPNGGAAIESAQRQQPDCILLDHHLPDMDGIRVIEALRNPAGEAASAIVYMTGDQDEELVSAALKAGAIDYLSKSRLGPELLNQIVRSSVERFRLISEKRKLEARYRAIVTGSADAISSTDLEGRIVTWNVGAEEIFGWSAHEAVGTFVLDQHVPAEARGEYASFLGAARAGRSMHLETVRFHKHGHKVEISVTMTPLFEQGVVTGVASIMRDITERKRAEEKIQFLMGEVTHRAKNLLMVIMAMGRETGRRASSLQEFQERFEKRLFALSGSVDLLASENWEGVPVAQLVRRQLAPFADIDGVRVKAKGPVRLLEPQAAQSIGLALHELATNAVKYGSLSIPSGSVEITWDVEQKDHANPKFRMLWKESMGPRVVPPTREGYGQVVLEKMIGQSLQGHVQLEFRPEGLVWRLDIPAGLTLPG